jgi:hypothetical protein
MEVNLAENEENPRLNEVLTLINPCKKRKKRQFIRVNPSKAKATYRKAGTSNDFETKCK